FSSRRRHTRFSRDWSSDVCSSDLKIKNSGASWIQIDEPFLVMDVAKDLADQYKEVFKRIANEVPGLKVILATYFGDLDQCAPWVAKLPVYALHIDLVRGKEGLDKVLESLDRKSTRL